ncbi:MAG: glycosyltransferase family 9 protein [Burkholderiales bacterium]|nr:glycosyltransferase family 9 protein [Burkholderiales bacterium]
MSRLATRAHVVPRALLRLGRRARPTRIERILVAHHLLLGDTLMLGALLARLRRQHPRADIVFTVPPACLPLYAARPWGIEAIAFDPRRPGDARAVTRRGPFDLAYVPGDNRHALLARAAGARWVVAFERDTPGWKNRLIDELIPWPDRPTHLADLFARLAGEGDEVFNVEDWRAPPHAPFALPAPPYVVLHVGAGSPLRHWEPQRWRALAEHLRQRAAPLKVVWSAGPGEEGLVTAIDPQQRHPSLAGQLDLAQLWHLLAGASLLVAPDTGVVHLARITGTPTLCLFGPGSDVLFGASRFWRAHRFEAVIAADFPCRDQRTLFKREIAWVRRCQRGTDRCAAPACMDALGVDTAIAACERLLAP